MSKEEDNRRKSLPSICRFRMKRLSEIALFAGILLFCLCTRGAAQAASQTAKSIPALKSLQNKPAPDFALTDLRHARVHLAAWRGHIVLLNFWATWCAPCLEEMPRFVQWQNQYRAQGLQVVGVSMDDAPSDAVKLSQKLSLNYPVVMGDERIGELYGGVLGLPVTFLIDRKGIIRAQFKGQTDPQKIEAQVLALLNEAHPEP